jgi:hypothetical protein
MSCTILSGPGTTDTLGPFEATDGADGLVPFARQYLEIDRCESAMQGVHMTSEPYDSVLANGLETEVISIYSSEGTSGLPVEFHCEFSHRPSRADNPNFLGNPLPLIH